MQRILRSGKRRAADEHGSATGGVTLHAAGVRGGLQLSLIAGDRSYAAERPGPPHGDVVAAGPELGDRVVAAPRLHGERAELRPAREERAREVVGVELRRVDGGLEVRVEVDVAPGCFRTGVSFIPQMGQLPGLFWMTVGCMPQV